MDTSCDILVFHQKHVLEFVWLDFHCCDWTISFENRALSPKYQAKCISWIFTTRSVTQVQRNFLNGFSRESPLQPTTVLDKKFVETRSVLNKKCTLDAPQVKTTLDLFVKHLFPQSPGKSINTASIYGLPHNLIKIQNIEHRWTKTECYWCTLSWWCPLITKHMNRACECTAALNIESNKWKKFRNKMKY